MTAQQKSRAGCEPATALSHNILKLHVNPPRPAQSPLISAAIVESHKRTFVEVLAECGLPTMMQTMLLAAAGSWCKASAIHAVNVAASEGAELLKEVVA